MALKGPTRDWNEIRAWADLQGIVPANVGPHRIDSEPAFMALLHRKTIEETTLVKEMTWEEFFLRFEELGLTVVYDEATVYNEILRVDDYGESIPPAYRTIPPQH